MHVEFINKGTNPMTTTPTSERGTLTYKVNDPECADRETPASSLRTYHLILKIS